MFAFTSLVVTFLILSLTGVYPRPPYVIDSYFISAYN